ncbi:hypothetical protein AT705_09905 [Pseudoalteromonas rubra]|uniref:Uncharacterized protein n=1 Tax=Pseudoalteromonas rubra TaxID=43658 RepID=A0A0U3GEF2_9GAMM|nr:hypothetical protein AT705_09905 [Pseudoalteromonas rubra]
MVIAAGFVNAAVSKKLLALKLDVVGIDNINNGASDELNHARLKSISDDKKWSQNLAHALR